MGFDGNPSLARNLRRPYGKSFSVRNLRRSFHVEDVTIDVEEDFRENGGIRLTERGRGYVKVMILYEEELQWLQLMCRKEKLKYGRSVQLGCLKGGNRTLICSRISFGAARKLELRLFAPYGRRQPCIPEVAVGLGWFFFVEILDCFVMRKFGDQLKRQSNPMRSSSSIKRKDFPHFERSTRKPESAHLQKTYLQAASLPKWGFSGSMSSFIDEKENSVVINFKEAVERSFHMARCLVGRSGGTVQKSSDLEGLKRWADRSWRFPGGVEIKELSPELSPDTFLFIFPSRELADQKIGKFSVNGYPLFLDRWHSWSCCNRRGLSQSSTWIRVVGLPVFLWDIGTFESIGNYCGGYLETAEETLSQSHLKWAKLRIKGNGRNVPASVNIRVGKSLYNCPIWVDRRPWVDWFSSLVNFSDGRRSLGLRKMTSATAPVKVPEGGSRRVRRINGPRDLKRSHKYNSPKYGKVRWMKVSNSKEAQLNPNTNSEALKECQPSLNRFDILKSINGSMDMEFEKEKEFKAPSGAVESLSEFPPHAEVSSMDNQLSKELLTRGNLCNESFNDSASDLSSDFLSGNYSEDLMEAFPALMDVQDIRSNGANEIIDCLPLASYRPEEWNLPSETLLLSNCGADQKQISKWVINRMKSFKKLLGISSVGFEDRIMDLLILIEEKRGVNQKKEGRKLAVNSRRGLRELRNLQSAISYDKKEQKQTLGDRKSDDPLSICF